MNIPDFYCSIFLAQTVPIPPTCLLLTQFNRYSRNDAIITLVTAEVVCSFHVHYNISMSTTTTHYRFVQKGINTH